MKSSTDKITILLGCYFTLSMNAYTAGMTDDFTNHVFSTFIPTSTPLLNRKLHIGLPTNWPLCYIVRPFVRMDTCRCITKPIFKANFRNAIVLLKLNLLRIQTTNGSRYPTSGTRLPCTPFLPLRYRILQIIRPNTINFYTNKQLFLFLIYLEIQHHSKAT